MDNQPLTEENELRAVSVREFPLSYGFDRGTGGLLLPSSRLSPCKIGLSFAGLACGNSNGSVCQVE